MNEVTQIKALITLGNIAVDRLTALSTYFHNSISHKHNMNMMDPPEEIRMSKIEAQCAYKLMSQSQRDRLHSFVADWLKD